MIEQLGENLIACAFSHSFLDVITQSFAKESIAPENVAVTLIGEIFAIIECKGNSPTRIFNGYSASSSRFAASHFLHALEEFWIIFDGQEEAHPLGLVYLPQELLWMTKLLVFPGEVYPQFKQSKVFCGIYRLCYTGVIAKAAVSGHGTVRHKNKVLIVDFNGHFFAAYTHIDGVDSVAIHIQIKIISGTVIGYLHSKTIQPGFKRLDDRVIFIPFGMQNPFQILDAVRQPETLQVALCFQSAVIRLECQHGMEA